VDGEMWHATWEGDESELPHVDPRDGKDRFVCGGGGTGKFRAVRRPRD
jgi:hypothetical protein